MPELPEVDAITGVVARHAVGNAITRIEVLRGDYLGVNKVKPESPLTVAFTGFLPIARAYRLGKRVIMEGQTSPGWAMACIVSHMMMTGYYDWEHEPWTFDYVEADREASADDVRVRMKFRDGKVLRFHDTRLFGKIDMVDSVPSQEVPELMPTPHGLTGARIIGLPAFAEAVLRDRRPVKEAVMDQALLAGVGNIYANEGCHLAEINPHTRGCDLRPERVPILLAALRCVVAHSIPTVRYDWLKVYRRDRCGSCGSPVVRSKVAGRATFTCRKCQGDAT